MPALTKAKEAALAKEILGKAESILATTDKAYIFHLPLSAPDDIPPTFRIEEIRVGKELGSGGFGCVNEVLGIVCNHDSDDSKIESKELVEARKRAEQRAVRNGVCRYAIKRLHDRLSELERARAMVDLAVEAKYLSVVRHPNIIKLRGMAEGSMVDKGFFIIIDRLFILLDQQMNQWYKRKEKYRNGRWGKLGIGRKDKELKELLVEQMTVAYDVAAALSYLHENRLVFRDIKPGNIGFDARNDVKVFDFGLCRSLSPDLKAKGSYGYKLTGRAGSLPYMAPEVIRMETYDTKCDVYSFTILLWEILSLKKAFPGLMKNEFVEKVAIKKERLTIPKHVPPMTRWLMPEAWDDKPKNRPDMKRVASVIRGDLKTMTTDEKVVNRTLHMADRSEHSLSSHLR